MYEQPLGISGAPPPIRHPSGGYECGESGRVEPRGVGPEREGSTKPGYRLTFQMISEFFRRSAGPKAPTAASPGEGGRGGAHRPWEEAWMGEPRPQGVGQLAVGPRKDNSSRQRGNKDVVRSRIGDSGEAHQCSRPPFTE